MNGILSSALLYRVDGGPWQEVRNKAGVAVYHNGNSGNRQWNHWFTRLLKEHWGHDIEVKYAWDVKLNELNTPKE